MTRRTTIELARQAGQPVEEGRLTAGNPGPLTTQLRDLYWAAHSDPRYTTPVRYDEP